MTDPLASKVARKFLGQETQEEEVVAVAPPGWEGPIKDKGAMAGAKMRQGTETYAHAQDLESFVKDFHKFLKDPDAQVDESWRH